MPPWTLRRIATRPLGKPTRIPFGDRAAPCSVHDRPGRAVVIQRPPSSALSVVVPTRDRSARLQALLHALAGQAGAGLEVIVVVDGGPAEVEATAGMRVLRHAIARGPAAARNSGWRAASAPLVAFTDDDCVPALGWAAALLAAAAAAPGAVVQGRVAPHPDELAALGPFARTLRVDGAGPWFQTANILYPRALLERLGGFDERFPGPAGEDTDLGWRARAAGARAVFAPGALVWHAVHPRTALDAARDAARWTPAVRTVARHPALRAHLHRRVFWKRSHEALLLAALGLACARRTRGASAALALPWLLVHRREHPSRGSLARHLGGHLLVDAAETAAMLRGSAAARTFVV